MKKIIVTGGLGFIGSNLINLLLQKKFYVINLDKISYSSNFYNTKEYKKSDFGKKTKMLNVATMATGGRIKKAMGGSLKSVPAGNKGLKKLPTEVRNKMGFMKKGGKVHGK